MSVGIIEAHDDCAHPEFDITGRCVSCGRDFYAQRAEGAVSEAMIDAEDARMAAAMAEHPEEFPNCVVRLV